MTPEEDQESRKIIFFYGHTKGDYKCFSNFYPVKFNDNDGIEYCCSEQYFMKKKQELFDPENLMLGNQILDSRNPTQIKKLGRQVRNFDEGVWNEHKFEIMCEAVFWKFMSHDSLYQILQSTGYATIAEASPRDKVWGIGMSAEKASLVDPSEWKGQNLLGKALMKFRDQMPE